MYHFERTPF